MRGLERLSTFTEKETTMQQLQQLLVWLGIALPIVLKFGLVVGMLGTALEMAGDALKWAWLTAAGKKLEAIGADIPKLLEDLKPLLGKLGLRSASVLCLALALWSMLAVTACGLFGKGEPLAPVAACLPTPATLFSQVVAALEGPVDTWAASVAQLVEHDGLAAVKCAIGEYEAKRSGAALPADSAQAVGLARAKQWLAEHKDPAK